MNNQQQTTENHSTLTKIKETEQQTDERILQAKKEAQALVADAKTLAQQMIKNAESLSEKDMEAILTKTTAEIESVKQSTKEMILEEIAKLENIPHNTIDKAVDLVISLLLKHHKV